MFNTVKLISIGYSYFTVRVAIVDIDKLMNIKRGCIWHSFCTCGYVLKLLLQGLAAAEKNTVETIAKNR